MIFALRMLAVIAVTVALIGCQGDRVKESMNSPCGSVVKSASQPAKLMGFASSIDPAN